MDFLEGILNNKYVIQNKVSENTLRKVYLAYENRNGKNKYFIKILNNNIISNRVEDLIRFHNEISCLAKVRSPYIEQVYEVIEQDNVQYLVAEYIEGSLLCDLLNKGYVFSVSDVIELTLKIANGLGCAHKNDIIHRDLNITNIMVIMKNSLPCDIKITDFAIAKVKEFVAIKDPVEITNTFCYKSPEECGVINRNVDASSDLYSLGIIMYRLLTGQLPFTGDTISSIIHQHIASVPELPSLLKPEIPEILNKIILKLLEKEPGRRYQSARGLIRDLEQVKAGEMDFVLGLADEISRLSYKTKLIGRKKELEIIINMLDETVSQAKGQICLLCAPSGQGKSKLIEESLKIAYSRNIVHISGKCYAGETKLPYAPFKDALTEYLLEFTKYPENRKMVIRENIKEKSGNFGKIILSLNSGMKEIIGESRKMVTLDRDKENSRFIREVSRFFCYLAEIEKGLVLFIDDLQWADEGSLEIIISILGEINTYPLLLLATYRDDEVSVNHGVNTIINDAFKQDLALRQLTLDRFDEKTMYDFVAAILHHDSEEIKQIAVIIHAKSKGNPFFAIEVIKQLLNEKAVFYQDDKWVIDREILNRIEISSAVIEVVLKRIGLLSEMEKDILSFAAIIGREFEIRLLFELFGNKRNSEIIGVVDKAISLHLLEYVLQDKKKIIFIHERIKEAFYEIIPANRRKKLHIKIAQTLEVYYRNSDVLFNLAYHYLAGGHENKILEYAYPAGLKAKENYANEQAEQYFNYVIRILEKKDCIGYELWIDATQQLAEVCLLVGKYDRGILLLTSLLSYVSRNIDQAAIYKQIAEAYYKKGDNARCEVAGRKGLALLGEKLPVKKPAVILSICKEIFKHFLHIFFPLLFVRKTIPGNPEKDKLIISFYWVINWSYVISDTLKFARSILRMLNISEAKIGKSRELSMSISAYAALCMAIPLFKRSLKYHNKGLRLKQEMNDDYGMAQSLQFLGFCYEWMGDYRKAIEYFEKGADIFRKVGDIKEYTVTVIGIVECHFLLGEYEKALKIMKIYSKFAYKSRDVYAISNLHTNYMKIYFEQGRLDKAEAAGIKGYDLSYANKIWFVNCIIAIAQGRLYINKNEISKAIYLLRKTREIEKKYNQLPHYVSHLTSIYAEACLLDYSMNMVMNKSTDNTQLKKIEKLCKEAIKKTKSWVTHYCTALLVNAKYAALTGNTPKAKKFFLQSIKHAEKYNRRFYEGKSYYEYGLFLKNQGKETEAQFILKKAFKVFSEINSRLYQKRIAEILGIEFEDSESSSKFRFINKQRFSSIMQITQHISTILDVEELLSKVLDHAIKITGAQKGCLFIRNEDTEQLELKVSNNYSANEINDTIIRLVKDVELSEQSKITSGQDDDTGSILCIPLLTKDGVLGICYLENRLSNRVFSEDDKEFLEIIMTQAAIYITNASLYEQATRDGLTKLYIHRHFHHLLEQEIKRTNRYQHSCSLIMIDVDFFKIFNDRYGHQVGDLVLKSVAEIIKSNCRDTDYAARYGGEEFCIILPETTSAEAAKAAENIRAAVDNFTIKQSEDYLQITISLGIAEYPYHAKSKDELIKFADDAMYQSKKTGRNRVTIYRVG